MPHQEIHVREAVPGDAKLIEELYHELVGNPAVKVFPERIARIAGDPQTRLLVAEVADSIRGTALLTLCLDAMFGNQPFAVVENVIVAERSRALGVGAALFAKLEGVAVDAHCSKIMLLSSNTRSEAHIFFERMGFEGDNKRGFVKYRRSFRNTFSPPHDVHT